MKKLLFLAALSTAALFATNPVVTQVRINQPGTPVDVLQVIIFPQDDEERRYEVTATCGETKQVQDIRHTSTAFIVPSGLVCVIKVSELKTVGSTTIPSGPVNFSFRK